MRNIIIGTAGHVDHGKTEIVKALTGKNTDRLEEERARGISIVLGFAPLDLGEGITAGIVDVPGHERFVKNMVSGAAGVDLALIVVAADEGVMPQTVEHFEVLRLLGVNTAVVAVTKIDLADAEIAGIVESEMTDMLEGTGLEGAPFIRTSSVTGEGIEQLRKALRDASEKVSVNRREDYFRLPVDRVFSRPGIGSIVTGTAWSGSVHKGDELVAEPGSRKVRVREVHNFDRAMEESQAGTRTALALHGIKPGDISAGCQILTPGVGRLSSILDAVVEMSSIPGSRLVNRQRVRFHHAASETLARVVLIGKEELLEKERGFIQLRMEKPVLAIGGDRFIMRTYSPMRVLAGGSIIDPVAGKARRSDESLLGELKSLSEGSIEESVFTLVARRGQEGLQVGDLRLYGLGPKQAGMATELLEKSGRVIRLEEMLVSAEEVEKCKKSVMVILERYSEKNPLLWGMDREQLRQEAGLVDGPVFQHILEEGRKNKNLFFRGGKIRSGSGEMELDDEDMRILAALERKIKEAGMQFERRGELEKGLVAAGDAVKYLHILQEEKKIVRIGEDGYIDGKRIAEIKAVLSSILSGEAGMTVGDFKEKFGLSRKYAVPILEYLDGEKITVRRGDARVAGPGLDTGDRRIDR